MKILYLKLKRIWCRHVWRFIGTRITKYSYGDYIYHCHKCGEYDITHIRKSEAINDCIVDSENEIGFIVPPYIKPNWAIKREDTQKEDR